MYQHLLVPIDDSALSAANVLSAVDLAQGLSARITFFYAAPDWSLTDGNAIFRMLEPGLFTEPAVGLTNALLTKAMASAKAANVPSHAAAQSSDKPAEAIIEAAQTHGCDLIVMASRGKGFTSGWLHSSQTEMVLRNAPVALLVTRVAAGRPMTDEESALGIIQDEHRSIAVVVQAMRDLAQQGLTQAHVPDRVNLARLLTYLREFPGQIHHPKEELHLHRLLRLRAPECEPMLTDVEAQHQSEKGLIEQVSACVVLRGRTSPAQARALCDAVNALATHVFHHIGFEERNILPLARSRLTAEDWAEVAAGFASNDDPRFGDLQVDDFRRMFTLIADDFAEDLALVRP